MAVLLKDVARRAKTSPAAVSQILNDRLTTIRVSESTRKRILHAASELGYQPNPIARSLRTRRTTAIGVVVNGVGANAPRIDIAERIASEKGYQLLLAVSRWKAKREEDEIRRLMHR